MVFVAMMMGVQFARLDAVMSGMGAMSGCAMRVMRRRVGIIFFVMSSGLAMMMRCLFVMFGGHMMMRAGGMLVRHDALLFTSRRQHTMQPRRKRVSSQLFAQNSSRAAVKACLQLRVAKRLHESVVRDAFNPCIPARGEAWLTSRFKQRPITGAARQNSIIRPVR